jgi:hypothetical protein
MSQVEPRIVARLPSYRERILVARSRDNILDELCRDYDSILEALEGKSIEETTALRQARTRQELLQLARDLEQEVLARLTSLEEAAKGNE